MYQKLLVAYDGSPGSERALSSAIELSQFFGARLHILAVAEYSPLGVATMDEFQEEHKRLTAHYTRVLEHARSRADEQGCVVETKLGTGHAARTIVDVAKSGGYDLLVLGHSGRSQAWTMVLGSTAERVSRHAPCSVLIVR